MSSKFTPSPLPKEVVAWNQTQKQYPLDKPLTWFLDAQVQKTPEAVAVYCGATAITYAELNRRANRLARHLIADGVRIDDFVGVCMHRSVELVVALLGIVKAGGAYVPLDPDYPKDRLDFMFADSAIRLVLTHDQLKLDLADPNIKPVFVNRDEFCITTPGDDVSPEVALCPDSAVYMIYTSGSTGKPKGVVNVHAGLVNRLLWMQEAYALTPADRVLQKTPYSFDVSVWEFFWPLITGASIVMAKPGGHRDNGYLVDIIIAAGVSTVHFVPSMLCLFLTAGGLERIRSLRQVMSSGEALTCELVQRFFEKLPQIRLHNLYGPTEASIDVTYWECSPQTARNVVPIGFPIANMYTLILDEKLAPAPIGEAGELHLGGIGLARGYWNRPQLTKERFIPDPFSPTKGARLYKTGDLARYLPDGAIDYLGRIDFQVKIRGFRIELGEIEAVLLKEPGVEQAVVTATEQALDEKQLVAYLVTKNQKRPAVGELKTNLLKSLPDYMVPARFIFLDEMPLSPTGKVDRKALPKDLFERPFLAEMYIAPKTQLQSELCRVWAKLLHLDRVGIRDNFFDLGGDSLRVLRLAEDMRALTGKTLSPLTIFHYPSIEKLALHISGAAINSMSMDDALARVRRGMGTLDAGQKERGALAVIGMAGRFPGAKNLAELWDNLRNGVESISRFTREELSEVEDKVKNDPAYVPTRGIIDDADKFDAPFFGIGPLEAKVMDPQQRIFLELAFTALEDAGYDSRNFPGMIGVYAGVGDNHYYTHNVLGHPELVDTVGKIVVGYGNEKDYIATRVSFALDLTGPSVSASTGCSTSLLAVDNAVKSLLAFECDMALAGGVDICVPQKSGQIFQPGGTFTKDGHCRPFDAEATGTMFSDGAGIVVLKRLEDALAAGDHIYAVVKGSAKNNDGANKVSFLAPSVQGQTSVIMLAQAQANVTADTISYVEAHGTGTPLGDPIEVEALTNAFRATTDKKQFCLLGSLKGNIGHPTIASGVGGFIKAALALYHEEIPATLHYQNPNPAIDFAASPFRVVSQLTPWPRTKEPRRAAVSSFGFGGTNVHTILEEAPRQEPGSRGRAQHLLLFSAKSEEALQRLRLNYAEYLTANPNVNLADLAYTTQVGRKHLAYRDALVCSSREAAIAALSCDNLPSPNKLTTLDPDVVFLFPGQGGQYVNMCRDLYQTESAFRISVDSCCALLAPHLGRDLRELLFPPKEGALQAAEELENTYYTQPAIFVVEYSLAQYWISLGLEPTAVAGHSIGEFAAACIGGIFTLEDVVPLVALRAKLISALPSGSMISVNCSSAFIASRLPEDVQLAAVNGPKLCVVSGPHAAVAALARTLEAEGVLTRRLHTSHAFHSAMMDPIVEEFINAVKKVRISAPARIAFMSTSLAKWIKDEKEISPAYWGRQIRNPVLFSPAVSQLLSSTNSLFLEVGPRAVLTKLARQHASGDQRNRILASLDDSGDPDADLSSLTASLGKLWLYGVSVDWPAYYAEQTRYRVSAPTYPFEQRSYWLSPAAHPASPFSDQKEAVIAEDSPNNRTNDSAAPQGHDEVMIGIIAILQEVLGVSLHSSEENTPFVTLGADSLQLMQIAHMVQVRLGMPVTFRKLTDLYHTPHLLAHEIRTVRSVQTEARGQSAASSPSPLFTEVSRADRQQAAAPPPRSVKTIAATPAQLELWLSAHSGKAPNCAYNQSFTIHLQGAVNDQAIDLAFAALAEYHEAARGHFSESGEQFIMEPHVLVPVAHHDVSQLAASAKEAAINAMLTADATTPYPLESGPLIRGIVMRTASQERIVILCAHHLACDGWSLDVMLEDFSRLYTSYSGSRQVATPPSHGFADFAAFRSSPSYKAKIAASQEYWRQVLTPLPAPLALPSDGRRPAVRTYEARFSSHTLPADRMAGAKALARAHGVSFFAVLYASLVVLIHRISGATDIVIGVPIASHPDANMEECVGHLVNMVPVRCLLGGNESFIDLVKRCNTALLDGRENAAVSFGELVAELGVARDSSRVPLVTVSLTSVHKYTPGKLVFGDCNYDYWANPRSFETFELNLNIVESRNGLEIKAHANADLYSQQWLDWRLQELGFLLQQVSLTANQPIHSLPLIPDAEHELLFKQFNATLEAYDRNLCLPALFEKQADLTPDAVAVVQGNRQITYRQLEERSNQLSALLRRRGVARRSFVGICVPRTPDMLVAVLATLKAGAAYVPLDPAFPRDRLAFMAKDAGLAQVISTTALEVIHGAPPQSTLNLDRLEGELSRESVDRHHIPQSAALPGDPAYVLYTSGSTGKPKGVCIPHQAAVNFLVSMRHTPGISPDDRLLAVTTLSFDIALLELMLPLSCGARVVIATRDQAIDGAALCELLTQNNITIMQATPASWRILIQSGWRGHKAFRVLCGGESLPVDLAKELLERSGELWNMYGPTETTVYSTAGRVKDVRKPITIGKPIANTSVWVLDALGQVCPIGVAGELYIGGDGLAIGYLNRPELTKERFCAIPLEGKTPTRLYRTGDLGRFNADGELEVLGRTDFQVKIRGFRIELGEIEAVLAQFPGIRQAVVAAREFGPGDLRLAGYVVGDLSGDNEQNLRQHLKMSLPEYMVPQYIMKMASLPLTPNGKVDRKALPLPISSVTDNGHETDENTEPEDPFEWYLVELWKRILGRPKIGVNTSFFDLGGHSLLAVHVFNEIHDKYKARLPLATLIESPTVRLLASRLKKLTAIDQKEAAVPWSTVVPLQPNGSLRPFFCVTGLGGNAMNFHTLAGVLGPNQPFYGLQFRGVDGVLEPHTNVHDIAREFLGDMMKVQPAGPYYLGGYSAGGLIAYEMARILLLEGHQVAGLILLDTSNPLVKNWPWRERIAAHLANMRELGPSYVFARTVSHVKSYLGRRKRRLNAVAARKDRFKHRLDLVVEATLEAERKYIPEQLTLDVVLLKSNYAIPAIAGIGYPPHESNGWRDLIKGVLEIYQVNFHHMEMVSPDASAITGALIARALHTFSEKSADSNRRVS